MPTSPAPSADRILEYTVVAANALRDIATTSQIPFVSRVCTLTLTIVPMVQNTRFQRERCLRIAQEVHHLLCVLMTMSIHSEDIQSPELLNHIAECALTLQKFDSCLRAQRDFGTLKRLFKQSEITAQLDRCEAGLKAALANFNMRQTTRLATTLVEFNIDVESRHQELLELITSQSDSIDDLSSVSTFQKVWWSSLTTFKIGRMSLNASSGSFALLPASPKIFHGRESELEDLIEALLADPARVAILGPGGMGKTTLAIAAVHHPKIAGTYHTRYFISCDSAHTRDSLVAIIASNLGLEASHELERVIVHHLSTGPPCLLVLDNFETPWEPVEGRGKVEDLVSLLTDVPHVALLLTMRGAERPGRVQWTRPFLRPLMPLPQVAARQTFIDIADEIHEYSEVDGLLAVTDNIPLAVQLVATIAAAEGCRATLERWKVEKTALLSAGHDKRSNLEMSIMLSLSSPRMKSSPQPMELLSVMSLLSDGISDVDLVQSKLPIPDISRCKTVLVRTSLAYVNHVGKFKVLAPIREYVQNTRPPSPSLVRPLRKHLYSILKLLKTWMDSSIFVGELIPRIVSNLGNLHNVMLHSLHHDQAHLGETIRAIILLNDITMMMNHGFNPLMLRLPSILAKIDDHELHGQYVTGALQAWEFYTLPDPDKSIAEAIEHYRIIEDLGAQGEDPFLSTSLPFICVAIARLYNAIAEYYCNRFHDIRKAEHNYGIALSMAAESESDVAHVRALAGLATTKWFHGHYSEALRLIREAHRIAVIAGNVRGECISIRWQAVCYVSLSDFTRSMQWVGRGKELVDRAGFHGGEYEDLLLNVEAEVRELKTEYTEARWIQDIILRRTSTILSPITHAYTLVNIAFLDIVTGASTEIVSRNLETATTAFRNVPHPRGIFICELYQTDLMLREGHAPRACANYIRLFAALRGIDNGLACCCLARVADPTNPLHADTECAQWAVVFLAFAASKSARSLLVVCQALRCLGDVAARLGEDDSALSILVVALDGFTKMDVHRSRAECLRTIGDVHFRQGDSCRAREMWTAAQPLFAGSHQSKDVAGIDDRLRSLMTSPELKSIKDGT